MRTTTKRTTTKRTTTISPSCAAGAPRVAKWERKVSVAISMSYSMVEEIDRLRGDTPRSIFVCKILHASVNVAGGIEGVAREHDIHH
jgi:hypothetical protein